MADETETKQSPITKAVKFVGFMKGPDETEIKLWQLLRTRAVLGIGGIGAFLIGLHDVVRSSSIGWSLIGLVLVASGALWVTTALVIGSAPPERDSNKETLLLAAVMVGCLVPATLLVSTISALGSAFVYKVTQVGFTYGFLVGLIAVFGRSLGTLVRLIKSAASPFRLVKTSTSILTFVGATLFSIFQFWYTNQYAPTNAGTTVNLAATLTPAEVETGPLMPVRVAVKMENPSAARAAIVASEIVVVGLEMDPAAPPSERDLRTERTLAFQDNPPPIDFSREALVTDGEVLYRSLAVPPTSWIEPGEELSVEKPSMSRSRNTTQSCSS